MDVDDQIKKIQSRLLDTHTKTAKMVATPKKKVSRE